ncbi:MAG: hypothetical protein O3C32_10580 [Bacteroidetes bacterium]|nr:hypothetical protein [Bacteroidota bacterium]
MYGKEVLTQINWLDSIQIEGLGHFTLELIPRFGTFQKQKLFPFNCQRIGWLAMKKSSN